MNRLGMECMRGLRGVSRPLFVQSAVVQPVRTFSSSLLRRAEGKPTFSSAMKNADNPGAKVGAKAGKRAKVAKLKTLKYVLHCRFRKNNTFMTLTKVQVDTNHERNNPQESFNEKVLYYLTLPQKIVLSQSTGTVGFRKAQRGEYEAAFQLASNVFKMIDDRNLLQEAGKLEIVVREFGKGRRAFFDALKGKQGLGVQKYVCKLSDLTPIKFGGIRAPSRRRI